MAVNGILEEIGTYLQTQGVATLGSDMWIAFLPDSTTNDNDIALYETSGTPTVDSSVIPDFKFQVFIRNNLLDGYSSVRAKAKTVYDQLHNQSGFLGSSTVTLCKGVNFPPILVRNPETGLWQASLNFQMTVKESFS